MKIVRFSQAGETHYGILEGSSIAFVDSPYSLVATGKSAELREVKLDVPIEPKKVICVGLNFADHAHEINQEPPSEPLFFFKPSSSLTAHETPIVLPHQSQQVEIEVELAIVIGKRVKDIEPTQAKEAVLGFTIANDVTARDLQFRDLQWARAKAFDSFCPLGPWIETDFDPSQKQLTSRINGDTRQDSPTSQMVFDPWELISFISKNLTLEPGDVILTGSPSGISKIVSGDQVECEIEGIGILRNNVT